MLSLLPSSAWTTSTARGHWNLDLRRWCISRILTANKTHALAEYLGAAASDDGLHDMPRGEFLLVRMRIAKALLALALRLEPPPTSHAYKSLHAFLPEAGKKLLHCNDKTQWMRTVTAYRDARLQSLCRCCCLRRLIAHDSNE
jgi:hypothetical protein